MRRFFPNDEKIKEAMFKMYQQEIEYRLYRQELVEEIIEAEDKISAAIEIVNNAICVYRILFPTGKEDTRNYLRARERTEILRSKWRDIPAAPEGLQVIRNKYEHIEEYYDEWFSTARGPYVSDEATLRFMYRYSSLNGGILYYMEKEVNIKEVKQWVKSVAEYITNF